MVGAGQFHVALGVGQGLMAEPLLEHRYLNAAEDAVAAVGVAEGVGVRPGGVSMPASAAARFILSATHCREMPSMGWRRSLE